MIPRNARDVRVQWRNGGPVITGSIIVICSLIWLLCTLARYVAPSIYVSVVSTLMFVPINALATPWTWFTSLFVHAPSILHVLFNMIALGSVGPVLERMMGHWQFAALYVISGLGGAVGLMVYCAVTGDWMISAYGASSALFGLFAAILIVFRRIGADIRSMLIWMAVNFAMPLVVPNIAWQAHVGGFIAGGVLTWLLVAGVPSLRRRSFATRMWVYGTVVVVLLLAIAVASLMSVTRLTP